MDVFLCVGFVQFVKWRWLGNKELVAGVDMAEEH
jgi:hypothetical protein